MLLLILIIMFEIWLSDIQYIDGKWVNVKKLEEERKRKHLKNTIHMSIIVRLTLTMRKDMMNAGKRISKNRKWVVLYNSFFIRVCPKMSVNKNPMVFVHFI